MGKRNKKKKQQPQHLKQKEAEQRKAFFSNFFRVLKLYGCEEVIHTFDKVQRDFIFKHRFRYPQIIAAKGHNISPSVLREMKTVLFYNLNEYKVEVKPKGPSISLMDHYTLNNTLDFLKKWIIKKKLSKLEIIVDNLNNFIEFEDLANKAEKSGYVHFFILGMVFSEMERQLYWIKAKYDFNPNRNYEPCLVLEVFTAKPEIISCEIDGKRRQIYRVGWGNQESGVIWTTLLPETLKMESAICSIPLPVYFQSHVLHRLEERLDCFSPDYLQYQLFNSLEHPVYVNFKGHMLIEYRANSIKYGYLVVEYIEGFILVKTFLFLTNNGTPEGKKLEKLSGLKKLDKKYWAIDKHSTFLTPDLANNKKLKALFAEAGCEKLFEPVETDLEIKECAGLADKLMNYIKRDEKAGPVLKDL